MARVIPTVRPYGADVRSRCGPVVLSTTNTSIAVSTISARTMAPNP